MPNDVHKKSKLLAQSIMPKKIQDFHNQTVVDEVRNWIKAFEEKRSKKALIIHGQSGVGKTLLLQLLFKDVGYYLYYFDSTICRNKKWVRDSVHEVMNSKGFFQKYRIIVIDDMDAFTNTNDFGGIAELVKLINPLKGNSSIGKIDREKRDNTWKLPIVFVCNNVKSNKFTELIKECDVIHIPPATHEELFKIGKKAKFLKRNIKSFVPLCKGDIRFFLNNIQLYQQNAPVEKECINKFLYDRIIDIFDDEYNAESILTNFHFDPSMFPSLVNENIYSNLHPDKFDNIPEITESISDSDLINNIIHNKLCYTLDSVYAYMSVIQPIFYMKRVQHNVPNIIKFPVVLGKNAVIYANKMAIREFYISQVHRDINHFIYLRKVILELLNNLETIERGIKYMLYYNITPDAVFGSVKVNMFSPIVYKNMKNLKHKKFIKNKYAECI